MARKTSTKAPTERQLVAMLLDRHRRMRAGAPVACPLDWSELTRIEPDQITVHTIFRRVGRKADPWTGIDEHPGSIGAARKRFGHR